MSSGLQLPEIHKIFFVYLTNLNKITQHFLATSLDSRNQLTNHNFSYLAICNEICFLTLFWDYK